MYIQYKFFYSLGRLILPDNLFAILIQYFAGNVFD